MPPRPPGAAHSKKNSYAGRTIARCKVGEQLGRGATSHVFRAYHEALGKDIALKILSNDAAGAAELRARFLSEARAIGKLSHENIVKVYDAVEDQGLLCILMELVPGPTLQDRLDDVGTILPRHAFRIAGQIARALEAAHEEKVVHRDVKPANMMLVGPPDNETVKVVDFGLAAQQDMNRVGTPMFMSPEAAQGKRIDEKSDVYALGVCLYRMLTGVLPFNGTTVKEILAAQVNAEAIPPSAVLPTQLGRQFDDVIAKLLVKAKGYRPTASDAADMLEDIADDLEEREMGIRRIRRRKKKKPQKKSKPMNPVIWVALAAVLAVVVLIAILNSGPAKKPADTGSADPKPPAAVVDPAQKAFEETDQWIAVNPANPTEAARRWKIVEERYPGTSWGTAAGVKRAEQEAIAKSLVKQPRQDPDRPPPEPSTAKPSFSKVDELERAFDFKAASAMIDELDPPSGVSPEEWRQRGARNDHLEKYLADLFDKGLQAARKPVKAKPIFPSAFDDEIVKFVRPSSVVVADKSGNQRTLPWSSIEPAAFFKKGVVLDTVLDSADADANLLLAVLAKQFGQTERIVSSFRDEARSAMERGGDPEQIADRFRRLFGE